MTAGPRVRRLTHDERRHARAHTALITIAFVLFWIPVIIFAKLADEVIEREPLPGDVAILKGIHAIDTPLLNHVFLFITSIGEPLVVAAIGLAILGWCIYRRRFRAAATLVAGLGGAVIANLLLKLIFVRSRPHVFTPLVHETSYSFPSGHAMVSSAFVGVVILLLWHTKYRIPAIIIGFLATFLIGLSRIYLGVHYPSDVLAGWCVGIIWAVLAGSVMLNRPFGIGRRLAPLFHHR